MSCTVSPRRATLTHTPLGISMAVGRIFMIRHVIPSVMLIRRILDDTAPARGCPKRFAAEPAPPLGNKRSAKQRGKSWARNHPRRGR